MCLKSFMAATKSNQFRTVVFEVSSFAGIPVSYRFMYKTISNFEISFFVQSFFILVNILKNDSVVQVFVNL